MGFAWDTSSLIENLNSKKSLENLRPELVEKKEPPIIIRIIKMNVRFWGTSKENPILEIALQSDKKSEANESPIPSAGAAISPHSNLVKNRKQ